MNNLATLILLGALTGVTSPAAAMEPVQGSDPPPGTAAGIVQTQSPTSQSPASQSPTSQSNVTGNPADQVEPPGGPPAGALSLSQIITQIESRPDFAYIRDIDWDAGRYLVQYRTRDGRDRALKIDPRTGRPVYGKDSEGALPVVHWPKS
ncbi:MAG: hypothetical protein VW600_08010 [Ferrovibrio sp.]